MDCIQMSLEFDTLFNNIMSNQAPGLNGYEKSLLLTKAQDEIVKNHLNLRSRGNLVQTGVDDSAKRQIDFSSIIETVSASKHSKDDVSVIRNDARSTLYDMPAGILMVLNETANVGNDQLQVVPLQYGEYTRLMQKPYKYPLKGQVWRLQNAGGVVELIAHYGETISQYVIRYIRQPKPIVLEDIDEELALTDASGNRFSSASPCELDHVLHEEIVQRAVELAKAVWSASGNLVEMGQRSE